MVVMAIRAGNKWSVGLIDHIKKLYMKAKLTILMFIASIVGFMVRLPRVFHHYDKQLHALFYFAATSILCMMYPKRWFTVVIALFSFGVMIECFQELSNKLIGRTMHGNFDVQDINCNTFGILIGTICFHLFKLLKHEK